MSVPEGVHAQDRSTRFRVPTCESVDHISFGHKRAHLRGWKRFDREGMGDAGRDWSMEL